MAFQKLTPATRRRINALVNKAWAAGLSDATFSQVAKDEDEWEARIEQAERAAARKAKEEAEAAAAAEAEAAKPVEPVEMIAQLRAAGRTVRQIAAAIGVHASTVYRWARGAFRPAAARLAALTALVTP